MRPTLLCASALYLLACASAEPEPAPEAPRVTQTAPEALKDGHEVDPALCGEDSNKAAREMVEKIYYGTRAPTHVPLRPAQVMAVVAISGSPRGSFCSGTLISERVVLTANHCTRGTHGGGFYAVFGQDPWNPAHAVRSVRKREHPRLDMALIELGSAPSDSIDVEPIPIPLADLSADEAGMTLEQAGFGQTENGGSDGLFFVAERFDGFSNGGDDLVVNGQGRRGVCFGDSGGPSMRVGQAGDARVVGALSGGDSSCVGRDNYSRTDLARDWIEEWTGPTVRGGPVDCGAIDAGGRCSDDGRTAEWCEEGGLRSARCGEGNVCGWSGDVSGWRCLAIEADPCEGLGERGRCVGETLRYCRGGEFRERPCGACEEACLLVDERLGFACVSLDAALDDDGDRVPDDLDLCSATPEGANVWTSGEWIGCAGGQRIDRQPRPRPPEPEEPLEPSDGDRDGVDDGADLCSDTPEGANVWDAGEWIGCAGGQFRDRDRR